jgi:hypothetical protein
MGIVSIRDKDYFAVFPNVSSRCAKAIEVSVVRLKAQEGGRSMDAKAASELCHIFEKGCGVLSAALSDQRLANWLCLYSGERGPVRMPP